MDNGVVKADAERMAGAAGQGGFVMFLFRCRWLGHG